MIGETTPAVQHGPDCACTRCQGFSPGNQLAVRHGAYSTFRTSRRSAQLGAEIRDVMPLYDESDEVQVRLLGTTHAAGVAVSTAARPTLAAPSAPDVRADECSRDGSWVGVRIRRFYSDRGLPHVVVRREPCSGPLHRSARAPSSAAGSRARRTARSFSIHASASSASRRYARRRHPAFSAGRPSW